MYLRALSRVRIYNIPKFATDFTDFNILEPCIENTMPQIKNFFNSEFNL